MKLVSLIVLFTLISCFSGYGQFNAELETKIFLDQIFRPENSRLNIKETADNSDDYLCWLKESKYLKKRELKKAQKDFQNNLEYRWTGKEFENLNVISDSTFQNNDKDKLVLKLKQNVLVFSKPQFLKDGNYCIFFYRIICGNICGQANLSLYSKETGEWKMKEEFCSWIQ